MEANNGQNRTYTTTQCIAHPTLPPPLFFPSETLTPQQHPTLSPHLTPETKYCPLRPNLARALDARPQPEGKFGGDGGPEPTAERPSQNTSTTWEHTLNGNNECSSHTCNRAHDIPPSHRARQPLPRTMPLCKSAQYDDNNGSVKQGWNNN
jgi:hypothetical protein